MSERSRAPSIVRRLVLARQHRREPAPLLGEVADGIVPATDQLKAGAAGDCGGSPHFRTTSLIIACALFMQNLDATVLATALPTMARDFGVPPTGMSLALTAYLLALAMFIPASGWTADRFGARRVFQSAIVIFTLGSIACGFSQTLTGLVAARFLQGMGGAMMVPVGRLVLLRTVDKRDLVSALAWLAMPALIGPILGPPVGGLIVTYLDWHWIFWINVPMGVLGVTLVQRFIGDIRASGSAGSTAPVLCCWRRRWRRCCSACSSRAGPAMPRSRCR